MSDPPAPTHVRVDTEAQTLTVEWADDHTSVFPLGALREACPCAECRGQSVDFIAPPEAPPSDLDPDTRWTDVTVEPAGSVGIRIAWDDGHSAGIYRWDRLRQLQPPNRAF